jgi:hypothetical protein
MSHPLYDVVCFSIAGPYTLRVEFDDHTEQVINFEPVLYGEVYSPLREKRVFEQVVLDEETHTLVWLNGADFDPWMLHEWPSLGDHLITRAQEWKRLQTGEGNLS